MTIEEIKKYPLVFDGEKCCGPNVRDVVYLWTENDVPCYVGITSQPIHKRCIAHLGKKRNTYLFQRKLRNKPENFKCYIIDQFYLHSDSKESYQHLLDLEIYYIKEFRTFIDDNPTTGYNNTTGGEGAHPSKDTRDKMSKNNGKPMLGKQHSEETKQKISRKTKGRKQTKEFIEKRRASLLGRVSGMAGKKHTTESIAKIVAYHTGRKRSPDTCRRISEAKKASYRAKLGRRYINDWFYY